MRRFDWLDALMILLFLLAVYFILTRIFGHSASDIAIFVSLFGFLAVALYKLNRVFGEMKVRVSYVEKGIKEGFDRVRGDINVLKEEMGLVKGDMGLIKKKLKIKG